jgi:histidine triad (HIT) family protein
MTCPICEPKGKILYEDEHLRIMHEKQASRGHILIAPKQHLTLADDITDQLMEHLFFAANYASAILFELTGAHGTNIIMTEGNEHVHLDIIERKQDDGLNFLWKPKKLSNEEMDSALKKIKDALIVGKKEEAPKQTPLSALGKKDEPQEIRVEDGKVDGKVNWMVRQLDRIP